MRHQEEPHVIYTIGSTTRPSAEFQALLESYGITTLVDVRIWPYSKRFPHFSKETLEDIARQNGFRYVYLGKELGGYRRGGYEAYMRSVEFAQGIDALEAIGRESRAAFMCCERFPWKCHRRFVALELERRGWRVIHIIEKDRTWQAKAMIDDRLPTTEGRE